MDRDNGFKKGKWGKPGKVQSPSNVTRIARAITAEDDAKHPQIVYYQAGIGTGLGIYDQLVGGGTGMGLSENIREAYAFLASNWSPEDQISTPDSIFLIGFSRGAFTARSLGGFIGAVGILTKKAMPYFYDLFKDWENAGQKNYEPLFFKAYARDNSEVGEIPPIQVPRSQEMSSDPSKAIDAYMQRYRDQLLAYGLTQLAQIKCIGVWDTVGALGIPINPLLQRTLGLAAFVKEYRWFDTRLANTVDNAFHALALDEHRFPFSPAVWELDEGCKTNLSQVWFPGAHSNCGGSYEDNGMANITLAWMMDSLAGNKRPASKQFDPVDWIKFDDDYIDDCFKHTSNYYNAIADGNAYRGWAMGKVYDSNTFPQSITGARTRTPGRYPRTNYQTAKYTNIPLQNTHEYIHSSVRARMDLDGREVEPQEWYQRVLSWIYRTITGQPTIKPYKPHRTSGLLPASGGPLEGWTLVDGHQYHDEPNMDIDMSPGGIKQIHWEFQGKGKASTQVMKEDVFAEGGYEEKLLLHDQRIADQVIFSNNRWHWFKKPKTKAQLAKTF